MAPKGKVYIIGAGPGDKGLLTLKGAEKIGCAEVIVYDRLLGEGILEMAKPEAELIYVGKESDYHAASQEQINEILVQKALAGKTVARVKGGDPFLFGRGGEEAEQLVENGIEFEIIPGVTSAIAVPTYGGIPVTHRDTNHTVTFITGHGSDDKLPRLNWDALGKGTETLVFYMARKYAADIADALIASGRKADQPAAIIANAARQGQNVTVTDLKGLGAAAQKAPALCIIVVGENVKLRQELEWLEKTAAGFSPA